MPEETAGGYAGSPASPPQAWPAGPAAERGTRLRAAYAAVGEAQTWSQRRTAKAQLTRIKREHTIAGYPRCDEPHGFFMRYPKLAAVTVGSATALLLGGVTVLNNTVLHMGSVGFHLVHGTAAAMVTGLSYTALSLAFGMSVQQRLARSDRYRVNAQFRAHPPRPETAGAGGAPGRSSGRRGAPGSSGVAA